MSLGSWCKVKKDNKKKQMTLKESLRLEEEKQKQRLGKHSAKCSDHQQMHKNAAPDQSQAAPQDDPQESRQDVPQELHPEILQDDLQEPIQCLIPGGQ